MNTKTMEGLIGAGKNIDLVNTPMRVYKEAQRKGDLGTMKRAMGYVNEFEDKAEEYRAQANEATQEETRKNREKVELEREETTENIGNAAADLKPSAETDSGSKNAIDSIIDTLEISETGRILAENQAILPENAGYSGAAKPTEHNLN